MLFYFLSKVEAATSARRFPRTDTLMHIALVRNLSQALEENVKSAFCAQVGGFICARRCQTTSQRLLTFGGLNKDFFFSSMLKKIYPWKKKGAFYLFLYLTFFFFQVRYTNLKDRQKRKKRKENRETEGYISRGEFRLFCSSLLIKRRRMQRESFSPGVAHGRLP